MARIVSQQELADFMDVSRKTITLWQREGLPIALETENGHANQYNSGDVVRWYAAREATKAKAESEKDRLSRLQGDKLELELAEMRGKLLQADLVEPAWTAMVVACRQALLAMSARLAQLVAPMTDPDSIRVLMDDEVEDALQKLSTYDDSSADGAAAEGVRPVGPAAADQAVAVG